jgi:hypothetical protein
MTGNFTAAASAIQPSAASTGFASVLQPLEFNAPLLVVFRKVKYPVYKERCLLLPSHPPAASSSSSSSPPSAGMVSTASSARGQSIAKQQQQQQQHSVIFPSMSRFLQWEAAVEWHAACISEVGYGCGCGD